MHTALSLTDGFKHVGKLLPARHEQLDAVLIRELDAFLSHVFHK
jgi:hypothetical protein